MKDVQIGFSTGCFYRQPILDCLEAIARNGFSIIEMSSSRPHMDYSDEAQVSQIGRRLLDLGLRPVSFHAPYGHHIDITHPDEKRRRYSQEEILLAADVAGRLGAEYFVLHPGPEIPYMGDVPERHHRIEFGLAVLHTISAFCRERGVKLLLENMLPHLFLGYMHSMFHVYNLVEPRPFGFCLDTGHAYLTSHIHKVIDLLGKDIQLVHANDNRGQADDHLPPGEGHVNWGDFVRHIHHLGFKGTIVLELSCRPGRNVDQAMDEACCARDLLKGLMDAL